MFYDSNKVNNILLCKQCEGRLDIPKNLQPTKISRGKAFDALEKSLDNMQKKRSLIRLGIENDIDLEL